MIPDVTVKVGDMMPRQHLWNAYHAALGIWRSRAIVVDFMICRMSSMGGVVWSLLVTFPVGM